MKFLEPIQQDPAQSVAKAMIDVIREFYIANDIKFDFIIYGKTSNHINDIINDVTKEVSSEIVINIRHIDDFTEWEHELNQSAIFFLNGRSGLFSLNHFSSNVYSEHLTHPTPKKLKFLIYAEHIKKFIQLKIALREFFYFKFVTLSNLRAFSFYLIREKNEIILTAQDYYSSTKCKENHLNILNKFNRNTQKWKTKLQNFNHFEDFYGCLLSFFIGAHDFHWYIENIYKKDFNLTKFYMKLKEGDFEAQGLTHEILKLTAKKYNFTLHYTIQFANLQTKSIMGQRRYLENEKNPIQFANDLLYDVDSYGHYSEPCGTYKNYFLVSFNDRYTNYEKLLMPFDFITWILLSVTFGLTFIIIFGSRFIPQWQRIILYGEGINNPAYNALGIIFGISQLRLPRESSNRLMLALFIWFCLMFRTCYQSMLFEFMTSDMRKPLPASIEDLIKFNYTIVYIEQEEKYYTKVHDEIIDGRDLRPKNISLDFKYFYSLYNGSLHENLQQKYAFLVNHMKHAYMNQTYGNSLNIMENEKVTKTYGYTVKDDIRFMNSFNDVIHWLIPSGIPQHLTDYALWVIQRPINVVTEDPKKILSMLDLEFGFVLWIFSLSLPITCFICEILIGFYRKVRKTVEEIEKFVITRIVEIVLGALLENFHHN